MAITEINTQIDEWFTPQAPAVKLYTKTCKHCGRKFQTPKRNVNHGCHTPACDKTECAERDAQRVARAADRVAHPRPPSPPVGDWATVCRLGR